MKDQSNIFSPSTMKCFSIPCSFLFILAISPSSTQAFAPRSKSMRSAKTRSFVFERMSEDAIQALGVSQELASQYKLTAVDTSCVLAGCVKHPDTSALQRTFRRYKISLRRVQTTLANSYASEDEEREQKGWLAGFRAAEKDEDLPFSPEVKNTLRDSGKLADQMKSTTINSHHLMLALLEYDDANQSANSENGVYRTLRKLNVLDDDVSALDFCETLLENLQENDDAAKGGELVTGTGGKSKTPTLEEVGVDLTQQAAEGLLDPVYGRDTEIRACVRTLIRRRKNCVCLIGDAVSDKASNLSDNLISFPGSWQNCDC